MSDCITTYTGKHFEPLNPDDEKIADIQKVARLLNTNVLSLEEYLENGGKFPREIIDNCDEGSFGNFCTLAGIKTK